MITCMGPCDEDDGGVYDSEKEKIEKNEEEDDDEGQGSTHHASLLLGVLQGIRMDVVVCASYTMYVIVERSLLHRLGQRRN